MGPFIFHFADEEIEIKWLRNLAIFSQIIIEPEINITRYLWFLMLCSTSDFLLSLSISFFLCVSVLFSPFTSLCSLKWMYHLKCILLFLSKCNSSVKLYLETTLSINTFLPTYVEVTSPSCQASGFQLWLHIRITCGQLI